MGNKRENGKSNMVGTGKAREHCLRGWNRWAREVIYGRANCV